MKVKEAMIPISEFVTVPQNANLYEIFQAIDEDKGTVRGCTHAPLDVVVVNVRGDLVGKVTMLDVIRAMEPHYHRVLTKRSTHDTVTHGYLSKVFKEHNLWPELLHSICKTAVDLTAGDIMHTPAPDEYVDEEDSLEVALHRYIVGIRQSLLVRKGKEITGLICFADMFEVIKQATLACGLKS